MLKTGARGTRSILEKLLKQAQFEVCCRHYVRVRLEGRAALLLVERNGCDDGLELGHQIRVALSNVLPSRFIFEKLREVSLRKHQI